MTYYDVILHCSLHGYHKNWFLLSGVYAGNFLVFWHNWAQQIQVTKLVESSVAHASIYTCFCCQIQARILNADVVRYSDVFQHIYRISLPGFHVSMCA